MKQPGPCWICKLRPALTTRAKSICGDAACVKQREREYTKRRRRRELRKCWVCPGGRYGKRLCSEHQFYRRRCVDCGGPIKRTKRVGPMPDRCGKCTKAWRDVGRHLARRVALRDPQL